MNIAQANTIRGDVWLEKMEGIKPVARYSGGKELAYHSPFREDKIPSFMFNVDKNLWIDNGLNEGGGTFELVKKLRHLIAKDTLKLIEQSGLYQGGSTQNSNHHSKINIVPKTKDASNTGLQLISATKISHPALLQYLTQRKISLDIAHRFLKEVRYKSVNGKLHMFGLGLPSGDGFAVSSKPRAGKGYVGPNISSAHLNAGSSPTLLVFEGFVDALSFISAYPKYENSPLYILNSSNLAKRAIEEIRGFSYENYRLFFDNDKAGNLATDTFQQGFESKCFDERVRYKNFADINDMICDGTFER